MKKNKMMRLASGLLVAVLITTSTISGTFAKYVTEGTATDTARVAKWGVTINVDNTKMFSDSYLNIATDYTDDEQLATITVQADSEGTNVVAPGTNGVLTAFDIAGTPEVDVQVTYSAVVDLGDNWKVDDDKDPGTPDVEYCPLEFTVANTVTGVTSSVIKMDATNDTVDKLETALKTAIEEVTNRYHTNTDLSAVEDDLTVTWAWPFYVDDATDVKDTALGDAAAAGNEATIKVDVTATITQID